MHRKNKVKKFSAFGYSYHALTWTLVKIDDVEVHMVSILSMKEMDRVTRVQTQNETIYSSYSANTLWNGEHTTVLPPGIDK